MAKIGNYIELISDDPRYFNNRYKKVKVHGRILGIDKHFVEVAHLGPSPAKGTTLWYNLKDCRHSVFDVDDEMQFLLLVA
jgi:hypothetical protein